jgi:hypothetical protein
MVMGNTEGVDINNPLFIESTCYEEPLLVVASKRNCTKKT